MRLLALGLATTIAFTAPLAALGQHRPAGGGGGGGHAASRPAAPRQAAPPARTSIGFDLHEDIRTRGPAVPVHVNPRAPVTGSRAPLIGNLGYGGQAGGHRIVTNPRYSGPAWGWNHGRTWNPAPRYWGGGFWGPFAFGAIAAAIFGTVYYNDETLTSYQVEPDSPGEQLLENYQLQQVPCGQPDLVVIFGPDDSVICAQPNQYVSPGEYQLDPSQLTIVAL